LLNGLYGLSIIPSSRNENIDSQLSIANIEYCDTWHGKLGHVNKNIIKKMMHLELIHKLHANVNDKYQVCAEDKQPSEPFKSVEKNIVLLELIHSDVCDI